MLKNTIQLPLTFANYIIEMYDRGTWVNIIQHTYAQVYMYLFSEISYSHQSVLRSFGSHTDDYDLVALQLFDS